MKLNQLDNDRMLGTQPIRHALRWLQTLVDGPGVEWSPEQLAAAKEALDGARRHLEQDVLAIVATPAEDAVTRIADLGATAFEVKPLPSGDFEVVTPTPRAPELQAPGAELPPVHAASVNLATHLDAMIAAGMNPSHGFAQAVRQWKEAGMPVATAQWPTKERMPSDPATFQREYMTNPTRGLPHDFYSHQNAWRNALVQCHDNAPPDREPTSNSDGTFDRSYWRHELAAFDHAYAQLLAPEAAMEAQPDGSVHHVDPTDRGIEVLAHVPGVAPEVIKLIEERGGDTSDPVGVTLYRHRWKAIAAALKQPPIPGLALHVGKDGAWLCFTASDGKQAMFQPHLWAMQRHNGGIVTAALQQWAADREADAKVQP